MSTSAQFNRSLSALRVDTNQWAVCSPNPKRNTVVSIIQLLATYLLIMIIVVVSLYNLTFLEKNREFWIVLVSSMIGIVMPSPMMIKGHKSNNSNQGALSPITQDGTDDFDGVSDNSRGSSSRQTT